MAIVLIIFVTVKLIQLPKFHDVIFKDTQFVI